MKFLLSLLFLATLATASFAQSAAPSPSPAASPEASPAKHHRQKKTQAAAAVASPTPVASPAAATATAASPAPATTKKVPAAFVPSATAAPGGGNGQVWVNTSSKTYHKEGSKWYGKTKHGKYMSEQDAIKEGDHPAKH